MDVLRGGAFDLGQTVPKRWHGRVGRAVRGTPLALPPVAERKRLVAAEETVAPGQGFLLCTHCTAPPLPHRKLG